MGLPVGGPVGLFDLGQLGAVCFVICSRHLAADSSFFNLRDTCFFQLFFWRACLSSYALLVLVCMCAFVAV